MSRGQPAARVMFQQGQCQSAAPTRALLAGLPGCLPRRKRRQVGPRRVWRLGAAELEAVDLEVVAAAAGVVAEVAPVVAAAAAEGEVAV